jgi:hypothetical protein
MLKPKSDTLSRTRELKGDRIRRDSACGVFQFHERTTYMSIRSGFLFVLAILLVLCRDFGLADESVTTLTPRSVNIRYINDRKQVNYVVDRFRGQLRSSGSNANIISCGLVTEFIEEGIKNVSFGAACAVQDGDSKLTVLMCDDSSAGKFAFGRSGNPTREGVVSFIRRNCPPGG